MAERTISVGPLAAGVGLAKVEKEFAGAGVERMVLLEGRAYVQFTSTAEVEALASRYPDCHVPGLAGAEIGFVEHGFKWPALHDTARPECLVVVRRCDRVGETSEARIRQIFKKFAIEKVARFEESGEVVLEFHSQDDLELIDMEFDNLRVPDLGPQAEIEVDNAFPIGRFLQRYLERNQQRVVEQKKKEESPPPTQAATREEERVRKQQESKRKMEEMEREIMEKQRLRKSQLETFERTRREKEERQRVERFAREKRERDDRERRELIEREERKKQEERRQEEEKKKQEEEKKKQEEAVRKAQQDQKLAEQERVRRETQPQQSEEQQLAERIAAIKLQVEAEEGRIQDRLRESVGPGGDQSEPELERILTLEKEQRKKEIKLPQINNSEQKQPQSEPEPKQNVRPSKQERPVKQFIAKDYSKISAHFITLVVVAWIYYILVR